VPLCSHSGTSAAVNCPTMNLIAENVLFFNLDNSVIGKFVSLLLTALFLHSTNKKVRQRYPTRERTHRDRENCHKYCIRVAFFFLAGGIYSVSTAGRAQSVRVHPPAAGPAGLRRGDHPLCVRCRCGPWPGRRSGGIVSGVAGKFWCAASRTHNTTKKYPIFLFGQSM